MKHTHVHYGAGLHGCLYQDGPHYAESFGDARDALVESYSLKGKRVKILDRDGYLELSLKRDGNEYCEITACSDDCEPEQ